MSGKKAVAAVVVIALVIIAGIAALRGLQVGQVQTAEIDPLDAELSDLEQFLGDTGTESDNGITEFSW
ncbi:MAG: hypothetical protein ACK4GQ_00760 [Candidatus Hadarchaeales archaeon]